MAKIVQAVRKYGPKVERYRTADLDDVAEWMAGHTGINRSEVVMLVIELHEALLFFNRQGRAVKLPDIGTFSPGLDRQGNLRINFRADVRLKNQFGRWDKYNGRVHHKNRIGWSDAAYKAVWDAEHPDDPLEVGSSDNGIIG